MGSSGFPTFPFSCLLSETGMELQSLVSEPGHSQNQCPGATLPLSMGAQALLGHCLVSPLLFPFSVGESPRFTASAVTDAVPEFTLANVPRGDKLKAFSSCCLAGPLQSSATQCFPSWRLDVSPLSLSYSTEVSLSAPRSFLALWSPGWAEPHTGASNAHST